MLSHEKLQNLIASTGTVIMSKKYTRLQPRGGCIPNETTFSSKGLKNSLQVVNQVLRIYPCSDLYIEVRDSHKIHQQIFRHRVSRIKADSDNGKLDRANLKKQCSCNDYRFKRTTMSTKERNHKRYIHSGKRCYRSRSKRHSGVSRSGESTSQDDSTSSSTSNSDLRSVSHHQNRSISSRLVQYTFFSVINTGVTMDQGTSASALCRSFLALYLKLDESSVHSNLLDSWDKAGQKIILLKGYNHKHLQYLAKEVRHIAVESNTLYRTTGQARVMLVLTAFGREEDIEEAFDDLCYLH